MDNEKIYKKEFLNDKIKETDDFKKIKILTIPQNGGLEEVNEIKSELEKYFKIKELGCTLREIKIQDKLVPVEYFKGLQKDPMVTIKLESAEMSKTILISKDGYLYEKK